MVEADEVCDCGAQLVTVEYKQVKYEFLFFYLFVVSNFFTEIMRKLFQLLYNVAIFIPLNANVHNYSKINTYIIVTRNK